MVIELFTQTNMRTFAGLVTFISISMSMSVITGDDRLESTMPAYAIATHANVLAASSRCRAQLERFREGVDRRKMWSLRMLDASGALKPGFVYGNNFWVGLRSQCHDTNDPTPVIYDPEMMKNDSLYRNHDEEVPPYQVNYFAAHFAHNGTVQYHEKLKMEDIMMLGLCLPDVCRPDQLAMILEKIFTNRRLYAGSIYSMDFRLLTVKDLKHVGNYLMNWRVMVIGTIFLLTLPLLIIGTWYDLCIHQKRLRRNELGRADDNSARTNAETAVSSHPPQHVERPSLMGYVVLSFSVYTNSKNIFNVSQRRATNFLDGLRFFSMGWVIMVHTILFGMDQTDNNRWSFRLGMDLSNQIVSNGSMSVDTYLFLSAFLTSYSFLKFSGKNKDQASKGFQFGELWNATIKRFLRLTPAYVMTLGLAEITGGYFSETSQYYIHDNMNLKCSTYWWRNLLYINNFFTWTDLCLYWSWYLSVDMQYFIVIITVLLISRKYPLTSIGITTILLLSSLILTGYICYITRYTPTIDSLWWIADTIYMRPWTRIGPSLIGFLTAFILVKSKNKLVFQKKTLWLMWILASVCGVYPVFGLYPRTFYFSKIAASIYGAVHRTVFSVSIAWIVVACLRNYGGVVHSILSVPAWAPGGRLTYCAYLLNPLIITSLYVSSETVVHVDFFPNEVLFVGFFGVTFIMSYIWSIMFELPYVQLAKLYYISAKKI